MKKTLRKADLTPELSEHLAAKYAGMWVAIREGELLASADDLQSLLKTLGDREATVLRIPKEGTELFGN